MRHLDVYSYKGWNGCDESFNWVRFRTATETNFWADLRENYLIGLTVTKKTDLPEMWVARPTLNVGDDLYELVPGLNIKGKVRQAAVFATFCALRFKH